MRKFVKITSVFLLFFLVYGCGLINRTADSTTVTGTVEYINLEGGFYGIIADNGEKLDPVNLKDEFKEKDLKVRVEYVPSDRRVDIHMWGKLIKIVDINRVE